MNNIIDLFKSEQIVQDFSKGIEENSYTYLVNNLSVNQEYLLSYLAYLNSDSSVIFLASNQYKANSAYEALSRLAGMGQVSLYIADELVSSELLAVSSDFLYERLNTINDLIAGEKRIIVTHTQAALKPIINKEKYSASIIKLKVGDDINIEEFTNKLITLGYKRTPTTDSVGDFSIRGEIIDIYPLFQNPVRINLFDTEIEVLKTFDPLTQMSVGRADEVIIYPLNEIVYSLDEVDILEAKLKQNVVLLPNFVSRDIEDLRNYNNVGRLSKYLGYLDSDFTTILEYAEDAIVIYEDYQKIEDSYTLLTEDLKQYLESLGDNNIELFFFYELANIMYKRDKKIFLSEYKKSLNSINLNKIYSLNGYPVIDYQNDIKNLIIDLKANPNKTFVIAISEEERLNLVSEILEGSNLKLDKIDDFSQLKGGSINLVKSYNSISFGFFGSIETLTEAEIFKDIRVKGARYRSVLNESKKIASKDDLKYGDYIVHYDYGIGQYLGIKTVDINELKNDYIRIKYANMELLIPVEKITLLEKYQGSEGTVPKLTNIGKGEWDKKKKRISEKLESIALDLITMQAEREKNLGYKYPSDNEYQIMFENDFEFEETEDQLKSVKEIKEDMEVGKIVDRLICGDVGYGKTEIAMRIAFKTVFSNKQVVYLAPTTILTRQHYYTFKDRFEKYGIRVELLNRLVSKSKQTKIIEDVKRGDVDILIGTHRILSGDINYRDLGLLIVDEEQRFGVVHKEKIKKLRKNINVLTLTATPIPRTLQMSIMGVRQLSLIETPPKDRYPIQTYVVEENDIVVKEAIYRELARGGQVFYLHNRVADLDRLHSKLMKLVPEAKIAIAHGQMSKHTIEDTIQSFIDNEYNVLLCTTIIETGIDIPNSNTLIIDNADHLGLSQLYQIRGRVGRTNKIAYAYLMYQEDKVLTEEASKRLSAIKEFTNLGSGYKIAVRDLAIRGAGDILGREQSGFIDDIGIDMYMKMLSDAINKIKGIAPDQEEKKYKIDVSKHVDADYVSEDDIKILIHKEIFNVKNKEDKLRITGEFTDRFGRLTDEILIYIEERYLQSLLKEFDATSLLEATHKISLIISKEVTKRINAESLFTEATKISPEFNFEYKNEQIIIKLKKEPKDKSWIFKFSKLLEAVL